MEYGYEGLGLFYTFLEKIAQQEKPVKTDVLKTQLRIGKRLDKCWDFMEQIGLIQSSNGETFSKELLNFSEKYQIKKEKTRKRVSEWRDRHKDTESVTGYVPVSNPPKVKLSKVKEIILYLNEKAAKSFKEKTPRTISLISARLVDGFTVDEIKDVIDTKTQQWFSDPKMQKFLRPETLFGNKFEGYLNESCIKKKPPSTPSKHYEEKEGWDGR